MIKKLFSEPRISYGVFFAGIIVIAAVSYAATLFGLRHVYAPTTAPVITMHNTIGQTITTDGLAYTVESFREDAKGVPGFAPTPGSKFLMPTVKITNNTGETLEMIPLLYFYIKDPAGNIYHPTAAPIMTDQLTGPLLAGETVREEIGFEVPVGIDHPALYFERGTPGHPVVVVDLVNSSTTGAPQQ